MITFTLLVIFALALLVITICAIIAGGVTVAVVFGDLIVGIGLTVYILWRLWKKKFC